MMYINPVVFVVSRAYENPPKPSANRLESTARSFACGILSLLKSKAMANGHIELDHDYWRYIVKGKGIASEQRGHYLYGINDFSCLPMLVVLFE